MPDKAVLFCPESSFFDLFLTDLQNAQNRVIVFSPFITSNRLAELLPIFHNLTTIGVAVIVITKAPTDRNIREREQYEKYIDILRKNDVQVIYKKNMHEKLIFIDDEIYWNGSLNTLSFSGNTGEIMQRFSSKFLYEQLAKAIDLEQLIKPAIDFQQQFCPACNNTLIAAEDDKGGFYWKCIACDYKKDPAQPYPTDGVISCAKCGSPYSFAMKKQPRWICTADPKHFQVVRAADLRLPKMIEMIPLNHRKEVHEYFKTERGITLDIPELMYSPSVGRPLLQFSSDMQFIQKFPSIAAASRATGINEKSIREVANGRQKHAGGYIWQFAKT